MGGSMDFPKKYFLELESLCPTFHADIYYYLGQIYYQDNYCETVKYFEKFLEFPTDNKKRISNLYADQKLKVNALLEISNFFCDFIQIQFHLFQKFLKTFPHLKK